jgi:hypothetical protein
VRDRGGQASRGDESRTANRSQSEEDLIMMKTIAIASTAVAVTAAPALANLVTGTPVPEIDALSGGAALAVLGAAVALLRERSRR